MRRFFKKYVKRRQIDNSNKQWIEMNTFYRIRIPRSSVNFSHESRFSTSYFTDSLDARRDNEEWVYWMDDNYSCLDEKSFTSTELHEHWDSIECLLVEHEDLFDENELNSEFFYPLYLQSENSDCQSFSETYLSGDEDTFTEEGNFPGLIPGKYLSKMSIQSRRSLNVNYRISVDSSQFYHIYYPLPRNNQLYDLSFDEFSWTNSNIY